MKQFLLDLIFPRFCLGCKKELDLKQVSFICEDCLNKIPLNSINCHICGLRNNNGACLKCRKKTFLKGVFPAAKYEVPLLRDAIHQFKYSGIESLKKSLSSLLIKYIKKENLTARFLLNSSGQRPILVPIPLTTKRRLSRGFNQSELLAKELSLFLDCPVVDILKRQKFNISQTKISDWKQRKENISGAFCLKNENIQHQKYIGKVILIDDVSTSGATLEEAACVLKEAGVKEIYGLVIAKG